MNSRPAFKEEAVYDLADDDPPIDYTRDGKHVFWFRFHDGGAQSSLVWDGIAGPRFDDFELFAIGSAESSSAGPSIVSSVWLIGAAGGAVSHHRRRREHR